MCSMADYGLCRERPSTLRFTHDSVSCKFSNGMLLQDTFRQFLYDEVDIDDMQCLVAMYYNGKWLVVRGNRRLYLYKKLQDVGKLTMVKVDKQRFDQALFERQYTSKNMGVAIRIRGFPNINTVLNQIANEWKNTQSLQTRTKSPRRHRHRSKSPRNSGNNNEVATFSGQTNASSVASYGSEGNNKHTSGHPHTTPTPSVNSNNSGISPTDYITQTSSINRNYRGTSQTYVPPSRSTDYIAPTASVYNNYSGTSNAYVPSPRSTGFKRTPTPSVNRNYPGTSQTYVPPPRSTDYIAPTLSIYSNNSGTSQTNKKDTTGCAGCCIIL